MRLCCFFNYAPLYRESVYRKIDETFDAQFYFGEEVEHGKKSGIAKLDYGKFRRKPIEFENRTIYKFNWRTKAFWLALKKYDTFLVTGDFVYSYIPLLILCKLLGKRVYGWGHGIKTRKGKMRVFNDFLYRNLTGYFSYGEGGRKRLVELGYDSSNIHVIYNSLTPRLAIFPNLESSIFKKYFNNDNPVGIFVGRLTPQKKLSWIIDAVSDIKKDGQTINFVFIGSGPMETELKERVKYLGLENQIWFYGECYEEGINSELLYNADFCASPGNVGLTALHAMQYGTPVISHDDFETQMPEYEAIDPYKTGMLYKKGNYEDFKNCISGWLKFSQGKREAIRNNCIDMINGKWNSDYQIEVLKRVLGDGKSE